MLKFIILIIGFNQITLSDQIYKSNCLEFRCSTYESIMKYMLDCEGSIIELIKLVGGQLYTCIYRNIISRYCSSLERQRLSVVRFVDHNYLLLVLPFLAQFLVVLELMACLIEVDVLAGWG